VIFSKTSAAWGLVYKHEDDVLRVTVKPQTAEFHEALAFDFDEVKPGSTAVTMRWDRIAVPFKVEVKVNDIVEDSFQRQMHGIAQFYWESWSDAAGYLLANKINLDDALKDEDQSIQLEERFDNLIDKSRILDAMGRKDAATEFRNKGLDKPNALQLYGYGRQLQGDKKQEEAFTLYRSNARKFPDSWTSHLGLARVYSGQGDFDNAVKEMKMALTGAPDTSKSAYEIFVKRLQAKDDINR
jgi:tetratricopeptide (TPR) repeat protein